MCTPGVNSKNDRMRVAAKTDLASERDISRQVDVLSAFRQETLVHNARDEPVCCPVIERIWRDSFWADDMPGKRMPVQSTHLPVFNRKALLIRVSHDLSDPLLGQWRIESMDAVHCSEEIVQINESSFVEMQAIFVRIVA